MLNNNEYVSLCLLDSYPHLYDAIKEIFQSSRSLLKKHNVKKNEGPKIEKGKEIKVHLNIANNLLVNPEYKGANLKLILETSDFLAFNKPVKIHSHPQTYLESDNCLSGVISHWGNSLLEVNQEAYDRGLLYRLDYETSGLMILAKNPELYTKARHNLRSIISNKIYFVIVGGDFNQEGEHIHYLQTSGKRGSSMELSGSKEVGVEATIKIQKLGANKELNVSLLKVEIKEGHRHQVRVQLKALGFPILGDPLYGNRGAQRMYLHCFEYHLNFNQKEFILQSFPGDDFLLEKFEGATTWSK